MMPLRCLIYQIDKSISQICSSLEVAWPRHAAGHAVHVLLLSRPNLHQETGTQSRSSQRSRACPEGSTTCPCTSHTVVKWPRGKTNCMIPTWGRLTSAALHLAASIVASFTKRQCKYIQRTQKQELTGAKAVGSRHM